MLVAKRVARENAQFRMDMERQQKLQEIRDAEMWEWEKAKWDMQQEDRREAKMLSWKDRVDSQLQQQLLKGQAATQAMTY